MIENRRMVCMAALAFLALLIVAAMGILAGPAHANDAGPPTLPEPSTAVTAASPVPWIIQATALPLPLPLPLLPLPLPLPPVSVPPPNASPDTTRMPDPMVISASRSV